MRTPEALSARRRAWSHALRRGLVIGLLATTAWAQPVVLLKAESGLFADAESVPAAFTPSASLPLRDGQAFGWRIQVRPTSQSIRVREELILPREPKTWGDPEPGIRRRTAADGKSLSSEYDMDARSGQLANAWVVTAGDPRGTWIIKVTVEGQAPRTFRFDAQ